MAPASGLRTRAARLALPPDTAERHLVVSRLLGHPRAVLDVGGRPGELAAFMAASRVTTLNVDPPADVVHEGESLPFPDGAFDAVASLDVLEHLDPAKRLPHLRELARVARRRFVACCPLGTERHVEAERELARWYETETGTEHRFLSEHLRNGLPTEAELRELAAGLDGVEVELFFHGDFRDLDASFRAQVRARRGRPRAAAEYAYRRFARRPSPELSPTSTPWSNRAFLAGGRSTREGARPAAVG